MTTFHVKLDTDLVTLILSALLESDCRDRLCRGCEMCVEYLHFKAL